MSQSNYSSRPLGFRVLPGELVIWLRKPQHRQLARYFDEQRGRNRPVFNLEVISETGIEQAQARVSELRALGFQIETLRNPTAKMQDRRKLFRMSDSIELVEPLEGEGDA